MFNDILQQGHPLKAFTIMEIIAQMQNTFY